MERVLTLVVDIICIAIDLLLCLYLAGIILFILDKITIRLLC